MYVEADKQSHVLAACKFLRNIFSFKGANLVPIGEMTETMTIQTSGKTLLKESTPGENHYVRIRTGTYKGDLAQVNPYLERTNPSHMRIQFNLFSFTSIYFTT
jgi:transcription elongation factor SPT5